MAVVRTFMTMTTTTTTTTISYPWTPSSTAVTLAVPGRSGRPVSRVPLVREEVTWGQEWLLPMLPWPVKVVEHSTSTVGLL